MATRMKQRRGTAGQWTSTNAGQGPILEPGEIGFESDTGKFKIGDGANHWIALPYFLNEEDLGGSLGDYLTIDDLGVAGKAASLDLSGKLESEQIPDTLTNKTLASPTITVPGGPSGVTNYTTAPFGDFTFDYNNSFAPAASFVSYSSDLLTVQFTGSDSFYGDRTLYVANWDGTSVTNSTTFNVNSSQFVSYSNNGTTGTIVINVANLAPTVNISNLSNIVFTVKTGSLKQIKTFSISSGVSTISSTEIGYLDGVTSPIQTQINSVSSSISNLIGAAPGTLDTLQELAAAINNDPDFFSNLDALPTQSGNAGKYLTTDGTTASWAPAATETPHPFAMIG